jgi:hypothetical protein
MSFGMTSALAEAHQADLRRQARRPRPAAPIRSRAARQPGRALRQRLGLLLIEAGLHLVVRAPGS